MQFPDNMLRLMQLFGLGPSDSMEPQVPGPEPITPNVETNTYNPRHEVSDQYRQSLQDMPQRTPPGVGRNILGFVAGLGAGVRPSGIAGGQPIGFQGNPDLAMQTADRVSNAPYYKRLGDWNTQTNALGKGAAEEDRYNVNERSRYIGQQTRDTADRRADIYAAEQESKDKKRDADIENANTRTRAYAERLAAASWRATHPNHIMKEDENGHIISIDPVTSQSVLVTDEDGKPIKAGNVSAAERIKLGIEGRLKAIGAKGAEDRKTEAQKETDRQADIASRGRESRIPNPNRASQKSNQPKPQTMADLKKKLTDAYNEHPEWQKYIDPKTGTIKPAEDRAVASAIHDYIYGKDIELPAEPSANKDKADKGSPDDATQYYLLDKTGKKIGKVVKGDFSKVDKTKYQIGELVK